MSNLLKIIVMFSLSLSLLGCTSLNDTIAVQDDFASNFAKTDSDVFILDQERVVKITRGLIESRFYAKLPKGTYQPVASSSNRTFYQSPEGFKYIVNGEVKSRIGGIVNINAGDNSQFYVWYFHSRDHDDFKHFFEIEPNGDWLQDIQPGILNTSTRPWIENEMVVTM
ncbi:hypothetical protein [Vibrio cortegadensis]|uniref:Uncharacterized protein n=1 Tax=Vibrio cortegadensis TaxID=1328770 RepID=A0ABV4MBP1_9VIBR